MRRLASLMAATALVVTLATPVAAAGPVRTWLTEEEIPFGAEYCGFPVLLEDYFAKVKAFEFPVARDGSQRFTTAGVFKSTLANVDTGESIDVVLGGHLVQTLAADGSLHVEGKENTLIWYGSADAALAESGQGIFIVNGRATEDYDATGAFTGATYGGRLTDVCAMLAE